MSQVRKPVAAPARPADMLPPEPGLRGPILLGLFTVLFGFCGLLSWSVMASISGAVIAVGNVVVDSEVKKVQHQGGGIVGELAVRTGQKVMAGDLLVRLDDTLPRSNLGQIVAQLAQLTGRRARLEAERDGRDSLRLPADFASFGAAGAEIAAGEQGLLAEMRESRRAQKAQLTERIGQIRREIEGLSAQAAAKKQEIELVTGELKGVEELAQKNLVPTTRVMQLRREAARIGGEAGSLASGIAKAEGQISEINLSMLTIDQRAAAEAVKELREVEAQIAQLVERRIAALDVLTRIEIRAPQTGFVHDLTVHTVGGVIAPGETIMQIVPDGDKLAMDVRLSPADIDQVHIGQKAMLRLSAFNQRTTPEVAARVLRVSAEALHDKQTGISYYLARLAIEDAELGRISRIELKPGMPVEAFIETEARTALSFFTKPLTDAFSRALREE